MNRPEKIDAMERHVAEAEKILDRPVSITSATRATAHAVLAVYYQLDVKDLSDFE